VNCRYAFASGGVQITLLAGARQGIGEVGQVVLPVAVEGCVEQGDALI
jgi:hypothetical protein